MENSKENEDDTLLICIKAKDRSTMYFNIKNSMKLEKVFKAYA